MGVLLLFVCGCAAERITRTADGTTVEFPQLLAALRDARVVFIGESHDSKRHHQFQLKVIQALHEQGRQLAIGAEMFAAPTQQRLDQWNEGRMDALTFQWLFTDDWSEPWPLYRDLFLYARRNSIPLLALNFRKGLVHQISTQGLASLTERELAELPHGLSCDFASPYTLFLQSAFGAHPHQLGSFENFCIAQSLWNRGMAQRLMEFLKSHPERTVVALVGTFHALKEAAPAALAAVEYRVIVPEPEGIGIEAPGDRDADFLYR